jgi:ABC-2 type transport system ATP-binding protein/lipopolysaccharide transport system ATP-binding protein
VEQEYSIVAENISMHFNMASERLESLKEYFIKLLKRQLFFKDFVAVNDVSFKIKKGEVFGIVGTNGSGKSTTLKMISGILKPTSGKITINGNIAPLIELGAGFDGELTARENIYLNGAVLGYSKKYIDEHFDQIVDFAELRDFLDMPIKNYSSGMVARIAFAIATVITPDILIVDEILSVGDFLFQEKCEKRINELMEGGTTIVIVSHTIAQIERLCDRVMWIEKGNLKMLGETSEVCKAYKNIANS